jgi:hypothetical protein
LDFGLGDMIGRDEEKWFMNDDDDDDDRNDFHVVVAR